MSVWRCRNPTHNELFHECWHGSCPICHKGVTAFDYTRAEAEQNVDWHIDQAHPVDDEPADRP